MSSQSPSNGGNQDYSKLKNAELESLLKERGLPHNGKKAEMVSRLIESDKTSPGTSATMTAAAAPSGGESAALAEPTTTAAKATASDATEAAKTASTEASAKAIAAGGTGTRAPNPKDVPNQSQAVDPAETDDLKTGKDEKEIIGINADLAAPAALETEKVEEKEAIPKTDYSAHLPPTTLEEELKNRLKRCERFSLDPNQSDAVKEIKRLIRFHGADADAATARASNVEVSENTPEAEGEDNAENGEGPQNAGPAAVEKERGAWKAAVRGLDEALPERAPLRGKKRERDVSDVGGNTHEDTGLKRRGRGGGRRFGRGRGRRFGARDGTRKEVDKSQWSSKDLESMELRKKRFGNAA